MTDLTMPNNLSFMKYPLKSVPGLADVGVLHGDEDGPRALAPGSGSKIHAYHVDQGEKLKGLDAKKVALRPNWPWVQGTDVLFYLDIRSPWLSLPTKSLHKAFVHPIASH